MKKRIVGLSTETFSGSVPPISREAIEFHKTIGGGAIGIGCMSKSTLTGLSKLNSMDIWNNFRHVSLYAPTDLRYGYNFETHNVMNQIAKAHRKIGFHCVIVNPDVVDDWVAIKGLSIPICIGIPEFIKDSHDTVLDLWDLFMKTNLGFVLDLKRCFLIDPSMKLAQDLVCEFSKRIREVHVSGSVNGHDPLYRTRQLEILSAIRTIKRKVPIIIKSACAGAMEAKKEFDFVRAYLDEL